MSSTEIHNPNTACCTIPPVQSDYTPKGAFKPYGDYNRVYVTGPASSDNAIVCVFDIFGLVPCDLLLGPHSSFQCRFFPQTQQGADILGSTLKTTVYMPDFFEPDPPFPKDKFTPSSPEHRAAIQQFAATTANVDNAIHKLISFGQLLKKDGAKKVGVYGFCWGMFQTGIF
jgi:dienelactone hydrolase